MKILFFLTLFISVLVAQERPKIALVLSGGGARGGAHVGVLKILEKNKIPIDMIVGTSMGSFVGGLYASGKSAQEIEDMLTTTKWEDYIKTSFNRPDTPMRRKAIDYTYQGRLGVGVNVKGDTVLPTGVLQRQPMLIKFKELTKNVQDIHDFDKLDIPFRAVATNIENGDKVVLKSGSLAEAIYASSSIPGGFQPIKLNGKVLVDGGVSDNMPIQVARDMGADIIIAVDVSENFDKKLDVNSYFVVMGQLVNILMRKNANESIKTLTSKDILITPNLNGFTGLDADKYKEIIARGVDAALKVENKLKKFSLSDKEYALYAKKHREKEFFEPFIVDKIEIQNKTYLSDRSIRLRIQQEVGQKLNLKQLREDLMHLYNLTIFDSVDYKLVKKNGANTLVIITTPSWNNRGEVRFALGVEDDFSGHSAYSLKVGYTMYGLNSFGGEWKSDFEIGRHKKAYTEYYQPLDSMQRFFIRPSLVYSDVTDIFPLSLAYANTNGNHELESSRYGASFAVGMNISRDYTFEVGISSFKDSVTIDSFPYQDEQGNIHIIDVDENYDAYPLYAKCKVDNLDNANFPTKGIKAEITWTKETPSLGSDYDYEQFYINIKKPFTFYANNITMFVKYGNTYKRKDDTIRLSGTYTLGGLFNLSGYAPYSFNGDNVALGVLKYTYKIKDSGFFGSFNPTLYAGFSLESGKTWDYSNYDNTDMLYSGTVYVAADTFLGPFYFAYGRSSDKFDSFYLYLGENF